MEATAESRKCNDCGESLPLNRFEKHALKSGGFGYNWTCRKCRGSKQQAKAKSERAKQLALDIPRRCDECKTKFPPSQFSHRQTVCNRCFRRTLCAGYRYYIKVRSESKCADCSYDNPLALEFAHFNRADKARTRSGRTMCISYMRTEEKVKEELAKGRFLCAVCHRLETAKENGKDPRPCVQKRRNFVNQEKTRRGECIDCKRPVGSDFVVFDFDHIDPSTKIDNVSGLVKLGRSFELIGAEMAKCDLVCRCCHILRTLKREDERWESLKRDRDEQEESDDPENPHKRRRVDDAEQ